MATVNIVRAAVQNGALSGGTLPVIQSTPINTETIASTGTSQATTDVATSSESEFWVITVNGGNVWVQFGASPTASANNDWFIVNGQTREFTCKDGDKVAVIDG